MKAASFEYVRADGLDEAVSALGTHGGFAKLLAGGQSLGPMINLRLVQPDLIVDISHIEQLRSVETGADAVIFGAGVRHAAFEDGNVPDCANGLLRHAAETIAYRAVRNQGTLGGSLAHADPAAEWPVVMMALEANINVIGVNGPEVMPIDRFVCGPFTTSLARDQVIDSITVPRLSPSARWGFCKFCRKVGDFAHSLAVVVLDRERSMVSAILGGMATAAFSLRRTAEVLADMDEWLDGAQAAISAAVASDIADAGQSPDEYDANLHQVAVWRAARQAIGS